LTERLPAAARLEDGTKEPTAGFESFRAAPYCLLVTFRRTGTPVPTPVCF
jgi:hypothetical protein